jgi:hypothetical protein
MIFAIRHKPTEKLLSFIDRKNAPIDCVDVTYKLELYTGTSPLWTTSNREIAEGAANNTEKWYNATYETPINDFVGDCEVVELTIPEKIQALRDVITMLSVPGDNRDNIFRLLDGVLEP